MAQQFYLPCQKDVKVGSAPCYFLVGRAAKKVVRPLDWLEISGDEDELEFARTLMLLTSTEDLHECWPNGFKCMPLQTVNKLQ